MADDPAHNHQTLAEARWRAIIDSAVDGIIVIDAKGRVESFNPAAQRLFGYGEPEVLGQNISMLMPSPYREEHDGYMTRYLTTGEQRIIGIGREVTGMRRDGSTFPIHLAVGELMVDGERHFTGIVHDLSGRVALEEQLREQASLARIGEMAAVIAHEVKNPLTAVRGAIQVIGGRLPADSRDAPVVKDVIARIDALNALMQDLLLFARPPQPRFRSVEIAPLLGMIVALLSQDPSFTDVGVTIDVPSIAIAADPELLKIVFQNLFINAAQAMQGNGAILVTLRVNGADVDVRVADTGPGIPADVRQNLFKPFFTTKARGTGLGLSTAKRLIDAHGGTIAVECPATGGTTVTLRLPIEGLKTD
jgi:two-component system sensor kinase FixL